MNASGDTRCPITVVTGFLGSGKTTLLSRALRHERLKNSEVLVNEYGQAGLDHRLLRRIEEKTRLLSGGCICCNMRDDLIDALKEILFEDEKRQTRADRVVIETTGLADPAPIQFSLLMDPILMNHFYVDRVICTLDAVNGDLHLAENPESVKQIVTADCVVITKTDLADEATIAALVDKLRRLNPAAQVFRAAEGEVDLEGLFLAPVDAAARAQRSVGAAAPQASPNDAAQHDGGVRSMSIRFYEPLDWTAFGIWMSMLLFKHGVKMLRIKGIVDVGDCGPISINGVQHIIHPPQHLDDWNGEEHSSQIVFIMRELAPELILRSLRAFQGMIGAHPEIEEINLNPFGGAG